MCQVMIVMVSFYNVLDYCRAGWHCHPCTSEGGILTEVCHYLHTLHCETCDLFVLRWLELCTRRYLTVDTDWSDLAKRRSRPCWSDIRSCSQKVRYVSPVPVAQSVKRWTPCGKSTRLDLTVRRATGVLCAHVQFRASRFWSNLWESFD